MFLENASQKGWIEVICGSMFSGKTEELIRRMRRAEFAHQKVEIFKPSIDVRYSEEEVVSHNATTIGYRGCLPSVGRPRHPCHRSGSGYGLFRQAIWPYACIDGYCRVCDEGACNMCSLRKFGTPFAPSDQG